MIKCKVNGEECPEKKDICCRECEKFISCEAACDLYPNDCDYSFEAAEDAENALIKMEEETKIISTITNVINQKKYLEEQEKKLKTILLEAMEKYSIKQLDNEEISITYIAETTATSLDSAKIKKKYPEIAAECSKTSKKSAYVKVVVK